MNILELDSFNLADTVKFHDRLNHRLWDRSEHLHPEVRTKLLEIAKDFQEFLGVPDLDVKDITISGSNAAYNYTKNSDIDLHLVVDLPEADDNEVYRELFDAKKFQYNNIHNIKISGYDVELYVQNPHEEHHSQGIYSLLRNSWVSVPKRRRADIDDISTKSKYEDLAARIDDTIRSGQHDRLASMMHKIKTMRQSGLEQQGEFGADNLAFKMLRNNGYIKRLVDARNAARDLELSLAELATPKQKVTYGFVSESPDGVNPSTKMFLEEPGSEDEGVVRNFIDFVADRLGITEMPEIVLHTDPEWSKQNKSFGRYTPETHTLEVNLANRHIMDTLRTTAHELVHCRQNQERQLPNEAGETGSRWENQAHAMAGVIMRDYADQNPTMFESSGYIPTNAEKNDPRFKMALSVDVRPGETGRQANKMALKTDAQGRPGLLMKSANLREGRMPQPSQGQGKYRDLNEPLGPETPPTMPAGTVRVDVSDVYDWYKLGQHISNMKGLGKHDFGAGPPSSIISFGDEETEHKFIKDLEATGLDVTDIDPKDPKQPRGMRRIKTDPTYNVAEQAMTETAEELEELTQFSKAIANSLSQSYAQYIQNPQTAEYVKQQIAQPITDGSTYKALMPVIGIGSVPGANTYTSPGLELAKKFVNIVVAYFPPPDESDYYGQTAAAPAVYDPQSRTVAINKDFLSNPAELAVTIAHEVQHGIDDLKSRKGLSVKTDQQDVDLSYYDQGKAFKYTQSAGSADQAQKFKSYLAMPHEVNARFTEVINDIKQRIEQEDIRNIGSEGLSELARSAFNQHYMHEVFPNGAKDPGYKRLLSRVYAWLSKYYKDRLTSGEFKQPQAVELAEQALAESLRQELSLFEEQDLFEVKMTSKNLAQLAKAIPGATVGLEFEMIVPNTSNDYDGGDMEPNYAEDERVRDIDDCVNFFDDGDYNDRGTIRRLRADMEEAYFEWKMEQVDERWNGNQGWEFFVEYLDREEPFDEEDYLDQARDIVADKHPELEVGTDDYEVELRKVLDQINSTYYTDQWEEQGRNYDYAYEEFRDEMSDDISEGDWLDSQGIRYASDVESSYDVTWPYWDSPETETDAKEVALNFMNYMGYDTIAVGDYHGYGGGYQLWNGSEWRKIGSNKPMDAFTVEPDGSLSGDSSGDTGLEFVSPPIPLDQIGETMRKVQQWASENGVYTGKRNSTSLHTNISIPGYDLDKLDYLKAAILLGDEYVLREFDRIGNTYAKPAIEKVKNLVQQKPEKAQELLDKMKSQLNAEASKLIHSGQTDKYTSINTKDNRIEFRSPGGDYLSIIADNPQKMIDTINRMVVVLDAAMDPNKYKEEYQKKLYKILTGQGGGREAKTGAKQEMKASDKDLLNIFTRYAAGELPKQALKSFVRQAQLERRGKKADAALASHNWAIRRRATGDIVRTFQADDYMTAHGVLQQYKRDHNITDDSLTYGPYNPSNDKPAQPEIPGSTLDLQRQRAAAQQSQQGNWGIWIQNAARFANQPGEYPRGVEVPLYRFPSREAAEQWIEQQRAERPNMRTDIEVREIEPAQALPDIFPELPRPPAAQEPAMKTYELYDRNTGTVIDTFPARNDSEAMIRLNDFRNFSALPRQNPQWDVGVRQQVSSRAQPRDEPSSYELYRISDGRTVTAPAGNPIQFLATSPEDAESKIARYAADFNLGAPELFAVRSVLAAPVQQPTTQFGANTPAPMYELVRNSDNEVVHRFFADSSDEAYEQASDFMIMQRWNPDDYSLQPADQALAAPADDWSAEFERRVTQPAGSSDAAQGGLIDVPIEIPDTTPQQEYEIIGIETRNMLAAFRAANQAEAEQTAERMIRDVGLDPDRFDVRPRVVAQRPTTGQQQFTGEWKVVDPEGREIYRFGGVGNSQSDANRVAMQWLRRNPRQMQGGVEVLPVMG